MKKKLPQDCFPNAPAHFTARMDEALAEIARMKRAKAIPAARKKTSQKKRLPAFIAAVILLSAFTAIGLATGVFRSIFNAMQFDGFAGNPTTNYEYLEKNANREENPVNAAFECGVSAVARIEESYYNGEQLVLAWSCRSTGEAWLYDKGDARYQDTQPVVVTRSDGGRSRVFDIDLSREVGEAAYAQFQEALAANGWAGIAWYNVYLGDGVVLEGVPGVQTDFSGNASQTENARLFPAVTRDWQIEGCAYRYEEYETPLPENARNRDELTLCRKIRAQLMWYCADDTGEFVGFGDVESVEARFQVYESDAFQEATYRAESVSGAYRASVALTLTPIWAKFAISQDVPAGWNAAWSAYGGYTQVPLGLEEDLVFDYEIWADTKDGRVRIDYDGVEWIDGIEALEGRFLLPDSATAVIFRPIHANSGAQSGEDIAIPLN